VNREPRVRYIIIITIIIIIISSSSSSSCGLFNDVFRKSDYAASNKKKVSELWIGEDLEGSGRGRI
jgi:hypothetical protein